MFQSRQAQLVRFVLQCASALLVFGTIALVSVVLYRITAQSQPGLPQLNSPTPRATPRTQSGSTQLQAWIYPGPATCSVEQELSAGLVVDVLKPEYFTLGSDGVLQLLTEQDHGCNGYSATHVELMKQHSSQQFVTISGRIDGMQPFLRHQTRLTQEQQLVRFAVDNDLTGIEIDFEDFSSWTAQDYTSYKEFIQSLGTQLHAANKQLLVAGPPVSNSIEESYYPWRYSDFVSLPVDAVVVMAYDYQADQGNGEPVAPNAWVTDIVAYVQAAIQDPQRIVIGIPAYGYTGTISEYQAQLLTLAQASTKPGYNSATRDLSSYEMIAVTGNTVLVYQDQTALQQKLELVESLGVQSVSVWHLGGNAWTQ